MICYPNAKINLGLNVTSVRDDGYHNLETVFYPVPLCDTLSVSTAEEPVESCKMQVSASDFALYTGGIPMNCPAEKNLVVKALRFLENKYTLSRVHICLYKRIPGEAGLGGGSSDATFMMKAINQLFKLGISSEKMEQYVSEIGADCAFFVRNKPVFASGIGNVFSPVGLSLKNWNIVIVKPQESVSTKQAYSLVHPHKPERCAKDIVAEPVESWKDTLHNDFEEGIFAMYPQIGRVKQQLYDIGATYAAMSGSGSAVFGLFRKPQSENFLRSAFKENFIWQGVLE